MCSVLYKFLANEKLEKTLKSEYCFICNLKYGKQLRVCDTTMIKSMLSLLTCKICNTHSSNMPYASGIPNSPPYQTYNMEGYCFENWPQEGTINYGIFGHGGKDKIENL